MSSRTRALFTRFFALPSPIFAVPFAVLFFFLCAFFLTTAPPYMFVTIAHVGTAAPGCPPGEARLLFAVSRKIAAPPETRKARFSARLKRLLLFSLLYKTIISYCIGQL